MLMIITTVPALPIPCILYIYLNIGGIIMSKSLQYALQQALLKYLTTRNEEDLFRTFIENYEVPSKEDTLQSLAKTLKTTNLKPIDLYGPEMEWYWELMNQEYEPTTQSPKEETPTVDPTPPVEEPIQEMPYGRLSEETYAHYKSEYTKLTNLRNYHQSEVTRLDEQMSYILSKLQK